MTKQELINLYNGLNRNKDIGGVQFKYAVNKNISIIRPEIEVLEKLLTPAEDFSEFEKKRVKLAEDNAKKDDKGNAVTAKSVENGGMVEKYVMEDEKKFGKEFDKLKKDYDGAIKSREKQIQDYLALLKEVIIPLNFHSVKLSDVPDEVVGIGDIMPIIDDKK